MPESPKKIKRSWLPERKAHSRSVDNSAFYNSWKWRKFSKQFKLANPLCVMCEAEGIVSKATVTDHIIRIEAGGAQFDKNNCQSLCDYHHNQKSGKEAHGYVQKKGYGVNP